ncbi:PREDICTED: uncharacterized protein LOC109244715 [Nicotiana attenuata]|uniref:uncharacterized protein LOC109244715 n=1 Tax=Nicotiana attenuata TaxID=49451 RepID=UPI0009056582|nr:PREDICTED: uncharacterized protein LOC109244715 [Nicotiana attenuata]
MEALKNLQQIGSVKDYQAEFDRLLTGINLSNENEISCFLGGLKSELNKAVRIQSPRTLLHAYRIARLQEEVFKAQAQSWGLKPVMRTNTGILPTPNHNKLQYNQKNLLPSSTNKKPFEPNLTKNTRIPGRRLSTAEMDERRSKGLCFSVMIMEVTEDDEMEVEEPENMTQELLVDSNEFMAISLQAFTGAAGYQTIIVTGYHEKRPLQVLIDTGTDGRKVQTASVCKDLQWLLQGTNFSSDFLLLPLGNIDIVLGMQWLNTLGRILFDFKKRTIEFMYQGKKHVLRGANDQLKAAKAKSLVRKEGADAQFFMMSLVASRDEDTYCHSIQATPRSDPLPDLIALIKQYACIFELPTTLPPHRGSYDHRIPLKEASNPVNKRPYRYPGIKKDIIEKLVQEMLDQGVIQHSTSPYASPVVLVGKKDGSWRLCVDYRSLNQMTIKDKFPIPMIEDLLDELSGAEIFSKIDLRAGYHQLRMAEGDINKTAFRTHEGHYEFLTVTAHVDHVMAVFELMKQHQLYAKMSKCAFGVAKVEYLGHFISAEGVSTDPKKIAAVQEWPIPVNIKQLRGLLGLAGYYRRFIQGFGTICRPLHDLLKKDSFVWTDEATTAFNSLKQALISAPVLAMPDYSKPFTVEIDASGKGIRAVLMQQRHPIAYISKSLAPRHQILSVYDRELVALTFAVTKWSHYLLGNYFIVKTDQKALKHLLEQQYKKGSENKATDALSRKPDAELLAISLLTPNNALYAQIKSSWSNDPILQELIAKLQVQPYKAYTWFNNQLRWKGRLVVGNDQ